MPRVARCRSAQHVHSTQVDELAESPLESISQAGLRRGCACPRRNPSAGSTTERGRFVGRCDFYWDEFGVVGEADGEAKLAGSRRSASRNAGASKRWNGCTWSWCDGAGTTVVRTPRLLDARIRISFDDGRRRDAMGFPRLWSVRDALNRAPAGKRPGLSPPVIGCSRSVPSTSGEMADGRVLTAGYRHGISSRLEQMPEDAMASPHPDPGRQVHLRAVDGGLAGPRPVRRRHARARRPGRVAAPARRSSARTASPSTTTT